MGYKALMTFHDMGKFGTISDFDFYLFLCIHGVRYIYQISKEVYIVLEIKEV